MLWLCPEKAYFTSSLHEGFPLLIKKVFQATCVQASELTPHSKSLLTASLSIVDVNPGQWNVACCSDRSFRKCKDKCRILTYLWTVIVILPQKSAAIHPLRVSVTARIAGDGAGGVVSDRTIVDNNHKFVASSMHLLEMGYWPPLPFGDGGLVTCVCEADALVMESESLSVWGTSALPRSHKVHAIIL